MATFKYRPAVEREIARSAQMRAATRARAQRSADEARRLAPVDSGKYRDSIHVEETEDGARVVADADHAVHVEFGTEDTPAHAPLRRGTEAAGLKIKRR